MGGIPDIYLLLRGVRIIIETKEEGHSRELQRQLEGQLEKNLCDLGVGLEYPTDMVTGKFAPPTTKDIRRYLMKCSLTARCVAQGATGYRILFQETKVRSTELPELLARVADQAMPDADLEEAIERVREMIERFARNIASLPSSTGIAKAIMEELELGEE